MPGMKTGVRLAMPDDRTQIVELLRDAHKAATSVPIPFSAPHAMELADRHIVDNDLLALVIGESPQGVLLASAQQHPFSDVRYATEIAWWIAPGARGRSAMAMLAAYEQWARDQDCAYCQMAALVSFPQAARLYERRGFGAVEMHYIKAL